MNIYPLQVARLSIELSRIGAILKYYDRYYEYKFIRYSHTFVLGIVISNSVAISKKTRVRLFIDRPGISNKCSISLIQPTCLALCGNVPQGDGRVPAARLRRRSLLQKSPKASLRQHPMTSMHSSRNSIKRSVKGGTLFTYML